MPRETSCDGDRPPVGRQGGKGASATPRLHHPLRPTASHDPLAPPDLTDSQEVNPMKIRSILALIALLLGTTAFAQASTGRGDDLTPRQTEIIQTVLNVEGFITEALHKEFWITAPPEVRNDARARAQFVQFIDRAIAVGVQFQRESWASVKLSLEAGRVVKSPGYELARKNILSLPQSRQGVANAEAMIKAAATGQPFQTPRGPAYITPELVDQVLAGLDGSIARFRRLVSPDWKETVTERRYPDAHVAILSQAPFALERQEITAENGKTVAMVMLTKRLNETDFVSISFTDFGGAWSDPKGAAMRTAKATLAGSGATPSAVSAALWRNRLSASGDGTARTAEGPVYVSVRVVEMRELGGALSFLSVTEKSKIDAGLLREQLEQSTQLLR